MVTENDQLERTRGENVKDFVYDWRRWAEDRESERREELAKVAGYRGGQGILELALWAARAEAVRKLWELAAEKGLPTAIQAAGRTLGTSSINGGVYALHAQAEREGTLEFLRIAREKADVRDLALLYGVL